MAHAGDDREGVPDLVVPEPRRPGFGRFVISTGSPSVYMSPPAMTSASCAAVRCVTMTGMAMTAAQPRIGYIA